MSIKTFISSVKNSVQSVTNKLGITKDTSIGSPVLKGSDVTSGYTSATTGQYLGGGTSGSSGGGQVSGSTPGYTSTGGSTFGTGFGGSTRSGGGRGGGGGGGVVGGTGTIQPTIIPPTPAQQEGGFTGKVSVSNQGINEQTLYYYKGQQTGSVLNNPKKVGSITAEGGRVGARKINVYDVSQDNATAEVTQPAKFKFDRGGTSREVSLNKEGIQTQTITQQDVSNIISNESTSIIGGRVTTGGNLTGMSIQDLTQQRRNLPAFERIKLAYLSSNPKKEEAYISIRGGINAFTEAVDIATYPLIKGTKLEKYYNIPVNPKIPQDIFITSAFSTLIPTTAQVEKELFSVGRTRIAGVTQQTSKNKVITDALFRTERAGRSVRGIVTSDSNIIGQQNAVKNILTRSAGQTYIKGLEFPTGRMIIQPKTTFYGKEAGQVVLSPSNRLFFSRGYGYVKTALEKNFYKSMGIGQQGKGGIIQVGFSEADQGGISATSSILKTKQGNIPTYITDIEESSVTGNLISQGTTRINKNILDPLQLIPPKTTTNIIPVTPTISSSKVLPSLQNIPAYTGQATTTINTQSTRQVFGSATKLQQISISSVVQRQKGKQVQRTQQKTIQQVKQNELQKTLQKTLQVQKVGQVQRQLQRTLTIQKQKNIQRGVPFVPSFFPSPRTTPILFKLPSRSPIGKTKGRVKLFVKEKGIFNLKGIFPNVKQAVNVGRNITSSQISRSFKITGGTAGLPFGYRYSRNKKTPNVFVEEKTQISQPGERRALTLGKIFAKTKKGKKRKGLYPFEF